MRYFKIILFIILILFSFTLSLQADNYGGQLALKFQQRPIYLNPIYAVNETEKVIVQQIFDNLVSLDQKGELKAELAESWKIDENGRLFSFKLREDVYFQPYQIEEEISPLPKRRVMAKDWKWSFEYLASPETKSPYAKLLNKVKGYDEYRQGESEEITGIKILDDYQLQIELKESYAPFIYDLTKTAAAVIPKSAVLNNDNFSLFPIGTGAFKINNFSKNRISLVKNDDYWKNNYQKEKLPYLDQLVIDFSAESGLKEDYQQYDIYQLKTGDYPDFQANNIAAGYQLKKIPQNIYYYLGYNYNSGLKSASEPQIIQSNLLTSLNKINLGETGDLPNLMLPAADSNQETYFEKIYKLAQQRRVENYELNKIPKLNLISSNSGNSAEIAELIKSNLQTNKFSVDLSQYSWADYLNILNSEFKDELFLMTYDYQNKFEFLAENFYSESESNYFSYNNRRVDNLIDYLKITSSQESSKQAYKIIEEILVDDYPIIFMLQGAEIRLFSDRIANQNLFKNIFLKDNYELIYLK